MTRKEALAVAKPILFNTEMVRAIQDNRKTVTRRLIKTNKFDVNCAEFVEASKNPYETRIGRNGESYPHQIEGLYATFEYCGDFPMVKSPFEVDDILYVRETWFYESYMHELTAGDPDLPGGRYLHRYVYKAESPDYPVDVGVGADGWHPSIYMPKWAARIFLRVTDVRVERLQDCGNMQAKDEGCNCCSQFARIWDSTVKKSDLDKYGWAANPWVFVIEFERVEVSG